jgi:ferrous iron transport protein A
MMIKKLSQLEEGDSAIIHSFESDELLIKLMEMGCLPGESIQVDKKAPSGDPVSILIAGYNLSLRMNEAELIFVNTKD